MVTLLNNLPSFSKDNFTNFQPDLNQCIVPKKQSFIVCSRDKCCLDEQVIVNQKCNLIIQYLDRKNSLNDDDDDEHRQAQIAALNAPTKAKKRDIREVLDANQVDVVEAKTSRMALSLNTKL